MKASRRTQPYRKGPRSPGAALMAMTRGRSMSGLNPADTTRAAQMIAAAAKRRRGGRPARGARPLRAPR